MTQISTSMTKRDWVASELRRLILSGSIPRGRRIQLDDIASRFEVSITPVREALRQLEAERLLVSEPHRGVTVPLVDTEALKAVYVMRRLAEPYAFARASRRFSRLDIERVDELTSAMETANLAGDAAGVSAANRGFHFLFFERCGIPGLPERLEELWIAFPWDVLMSGDHVGGSVVEHREIIAAVEADDPDRVRNAAEAHVARSYFLIVDHLQVESGPDPFDLTLD